MNDYYTAARAIPALADGEERGAIVGYLIGGEARCTTCALAEYTMTTIARLIQRGRATTLPDEQEHQCIVCGRLLLTEA